MNQSHKAALLLLPFVLAACATDGAASSGALAGLGTGTTDGGALLQCLGPTPPASAWGAKIGPEGVAGVANPVLGSQAPVFALPDFQPQSCGYRANYGLQTFAGKVTVVAILAGW